MTPEGRQGTVSDRRSRGTAQALQKAFPPDMAAEDVLGRLIEQIDRLPWPRTNASKG